MRKYLLIVLTLSILAFGSNAWADLQIDSGQTRGQAGSVSKFFVGRNARQDTTISADRVVIWDTTSNDGVSITTSTTSYDALVVGVTIDSIPGITSDATAAAVTGTTSNWGRVRVYGRHANVSWDSGATTCAAGNLVGQSAQAGTATYSRALPVSGDALTPLSRDNLGVLLEACAAGNKLIDIFVDRG